MNPKDKSMICRMAGNIAGPLLAMATTTVSGGLNPNMSKDDIDTAVDIVAAYSLKCAMRINKLATEKMPEEKIR